jgi:rare lipoprotein A (peptidoglycan hydrolase)
LLVNVALTVGLLPALFPARADGGTSHTVQAGALGGVTGGAAAVYVAPDQAAIDRAIEQLAPVPTLPTTTTVASRRVSRPVVRPRPRPKVTAKPKAVVRKAQAIAPAPAKAKAAPPARPAPTPFESHGEAGKATWYHQSSGICAHKSLPMGTVVTITNTRNGKATQCRVGDRGPFVAGYVIDLAPQQFDEVSSRSAGVFPTKITW